MLIGRGNANPDILYIFDDCGDTSTITDWVAGADALTPADETTLIKEGSHSMALGVDADKNAADLAQWVKTTSHGDLSAYQNDWIYFWVYFSAVDYLLENPAAIQIRFGSTASNYLAFYVANTDVTAGWNLLKLDLDNPSAVTGAVNWSSIAYALLSIYTLVGNTNDFTVYVDSIMFVRPA